MHIDDETTDVLIGGYLSSEAARRGLRRGPELWRTPLGVLS